MLFNREEPRGCRDAGTRHSQYAPFTIDGARLRPPIVIGQWVGCLLYDNRRRTPTPAHRNAHVSLGASCPRTWGEVRVRVCVCVAQHAA